MNIPLYIKIANSLEEEIKNGKYKEGQLLPTEEELESIFNVSRITVRNALGVLEKKEYVVRKQGKGTIVHQTRIAQKLNFISSFTETFEQKGFSVETGLLSMRKVEPPEEVINALEISKNEDVYMLQRSRIIEGETIAFVTNYILSKVTPKLEDKAQRLKHIGLYKLLEAEYGLVLKNAVETISVYMSGPLESDIFHTPGRIPIFNSRRITYLENGVAFELINSIIRADKYKFTVHLTGRPPS